MMRRYTIQHRYCARRDGVQFGPWEPGIEVELAEHDAEWVVRDSPGALVPVDKQPVDEQPPQPAPEPQPAAPKPKAPSRRGAK